MSFREIGEESLARETRRNAFAEEHGLRPAQGSRCLHWLAKGRCSVSLCNEHLGRWLFMDHTSVWLGRHGKRVMICQPYGFDVDEVERACAEFGLTARVLGEGFHGGGADCIRLSLAGRFGRIGWDQGNTEEERRAWLEAARARGPSRRVPTGVPNSGRQIR